MARFLEFSSNISPMVPGAFAIVTDPTNALNPKIISESYVRVRKSAILMATIPEETNDENCCEIPRQTSRDNKNEKER